MAFLLDTCAVSELVAKSPNPHAVQAITNMPRDEIFLSIITVGELHAGIVGLAATARKAFLTSWFNEHVLGLYGPRTFLVDLSITLRWGEIKSDLRRRGQTMQATDA